MLRTFQVLLQASAIYLACCQADQTTTPAGLKQIGDATGDCSLTTIPFVCTSTSPGSTRLSFDGTCTEPKLPVFAHGSFEQGLQANITCSSPTGQITVTNVSRSNCSDATGMNTDCFHTEFEISLNQSNSCRPVVCETIFNDTTTIAQGTITVSNVPSPLTTVSAIQNGSSAILTVTGVVNDRCFTDNNTMNRYNTTNCGSCAQSIVTNNVTLLCEDIIPGQRCHVSVERITRCNTTSVPVETSIVGKELSTTDGGQGSQNSAIIGGSIGAVVAVAGAVILVIAVGVWCRVRNSPKKKNLNGTDGGHELAIERREIQNGHSTFGASNPLPASETAQEEESQERQNGESATPTSEADQEEESQERQTGELTTTPPSTLEVDVQEVNDNDDNTVKIKPVQSAGLPVPPNVSSPELSRDIQVEPANQETVKPFRTQMEQGGEGTKVTKRVVNTRPKKSKEVQSDRQGTFRNSLIVAGNGGASNSPAPLCREPNSDLQDLRKEFTDFKTDCKTKFIQQEKTNVQTEKEISELKSELKKWQLEHSKRLDEIKELTKERDNLKSMFQDETARRESLERKLEVATERANDAERNVKTLEQKLKAAQLNPKSNPRDSRRVKSFAGVLHV